MKKQKWEVIKHSWCDTSIVDKKTREQICEKSIYNDVLDDNHEELEYKVSKNFNLMCKSPEMLDILSGLVTDVENLINENNIEWQQSGYLSEAKELLKQLQ